MLSKSEVIMPADQVHDFLGISRPKLISASKVVNIRKLTIQDPATGLEATYLSATDLSELLDREYEATELTQIHRLAQIVRQMAGRA